MAIRDLIPWSRPEMGGRALSPRTAGGDAPLLTLHREMNRLFDDMLSGFDAPAIGGGRWDWPTLEVNESDKAIRVTAEMPA